jgi:predicted metalloprotease with PDZ domain
MLRRLATVLLLASAAAAQERRDELTKVAFAVDASRPEGGSVRVAMTVSNNFEDAVRVAIPAWAPGAYRIVRYGKEVRDVRAAEPKGAKLDVRPVDEQTWEVRAGGTPEFTVTYDLTVDRNRMDKDHCYLAGPDTYFYVVGRKEAPCRVRFAIPEGWKVGTPLDRDGDEYKARDYDTFIDGPTELGKFELVEFDQDGVRYQFVIHANGPVDGPKFVSMGRKIVAEQNRMFGEMPFKRYVFLYHFRGGSGGYGLEHLNSTNINLPYVAVKAEPLVAASITSHEYFHLWNVKRIRPAGLGPFDYTQPVRTRALWFCEGGTSYFGDRALARCGIWNEERYFKHLAEEVETLQNNPDRLVTSVEKASWTAWDRKDYPRVDYYNKGELLGLLVDLKMRTASGGKRNFDDVLRRLYEEYCLKPAREGKGWIGVGFPEDGILKAIEDVSGEDWKEFFAKHVGGVEELPYREVLGPAGLSTDLTVSRQADLGFPVRGTTVLSVPSGGEAEQAGIKANDRIARINGVEVTRSSLWSEVGKLRAGGEAQLTLQRDGASVEATLKLGVRERTTCRIRRAENPSDVQQRILDTWLNRRREY